MQAVDNQIFNFLHDIAGKFGLLDLLIIFFAKYAIYVLVLVFIIVFLKEKSISKKTTVFFWTILSAILSRGLITEIIRYFYHHNRPFISLGFEPLINHDLTASFPSGHIAFLFALVLPAFYLNKKLGYWFLAISFLVGISRVVTGVHWPLDILGGIIIGLASAWFIKLILPKSNIKN